MLPGERVDIDTVLEPGELIEAIELAEPAPCSAYVKVRERESYEFALVSAAAAVDLDGDGVICRARIALGSVSMRPWRLKEAERRLEGVRPDAPAVTEALDATPLWQRRARRVRARTSSSWRGGRRAARSRTPQRERWREHSSVRRAAAAAGWRREGHWCRTLRGRPSHRRDAVRGARRCPRCGWLSAHDRYDGGTGGLRRDARAHLRGLSAASPPVPSYSSRRLPLQDGEINYQGEPIALVLAESLEDAAFAATLVRADVEPARFTPHPAANRQGAITPGGSLHRSSDEGGLSDFEHGDIEAALKRAEIHHDATYVQPSRHHNPIEPSATLAQWRGDELEVIDATQHAYGVQRVLAAVFEMAPERIRVRSPHTGGGFGCEGLVWPHQIVAVAAARIAGRPVRIALSRAEMYSLITYQPQLVQTIHLGASQDGRLAAIDHEAINVTSVTDDFVEYATEASLCTYAADAIRASARAARQHQYSEPDARSGRGLRAMGSWQRDERACRATRNGSDRAAARKLCRASPGDTPAVVLKEAA